MDCAGAASLLHDYERKTSMITLVIVLYLIFKLVTILPKLGRAISYKHTPTNDTNNEINGLALRVQKEAQDRQIQLREIDK